MDYPRPAFLLTDVGVVLPTYTPAEGLLDPLILIDRSFRWAAKSVEEETPVEELYRGRSRPVPQRDGLIFRSVESNRSGDFYFELPERLYEALSSHPVGFVFALIAILSLFGFGVRVRFFRTRDDAAPSKEQALAPAPEPAPTTVNNYYAPVIIINAYPDGVTLGTDEEVAHEIEERERQSRADELARRELHLDLSDLGTQGTPRRISHADSEGSSARELGRGPEDADGEE
jgi:hypothetical protein